MPKDKRGYSHSSHRFRRSPYSRSSDRVVHPLSKKSSESVEDVKEWEEARCPVCMEHPHNAVLLLCSSHEKGCRPYICDTSRRHSNCLDQFCKTFAETPKCPSQDETLESLIASMTRREQEVLSGQTSPADNKAHLKLVCPLCRGQVNGWVVVEPARKFMNAKARSCACETCDFIGTYVDLRKHARVEHPLVRPSKADPERQRSWRRMEQETNLRDVVSLIQPSIAEERGEGMSLETSILEPLIAEERGEAMSFEYVGHISWLISSGHYSFLDDALEIEAVSVETHSVLLENDIGSVEVALSLGYPPIPGWRAFQRHASLEFDPEHQPRNYLHSQAYHLQRNYQHSQTSAYPQSHHWTNHSSEYRQRNHQSSQSIEYHLRQQRNHQWNRSSEHRLNHQRNQRRRRE